MPVLSEIQVRDSSEWAIEVYLEMVYLLSEGCSPSPCTIDLFSLKTSRYNDTLGIDVPVNWGYTVIRPENLTGPSPEQKVLIKQGTGNVLCSVLFL
ncbi:MAG TPA: hypothetical protein PLE24_16300 [Chitinispirillaceae bacterium]|jgi:hypothetical protein|nr:hypothetical protein [Chitinispirillaceae bacterium]